MLLNNTIWPAFTAGLFVFLCLPAESWSGLNTVPTRPSSSLDESAADAEQPPDKRNGLLVKIPLPVDSSTAAKIKLTLKRIVEKAPPVVRPADRLVLVLEFDTANGKTGRGSELEACQSLARYLASPDMNRVETIAYIPVDPREPETTGQLSGHAVLIAIAANQIAMDQQSAIGNAGVDEANIDSLVRDVYRGIASQRLTLPVPVVLAMLEKDKQLFRLRTDQGIVYVDGEELQELETQGKAIETTTITDKGQLTMLTSQQLAEFRLLRYRVSDRNELAGKLGLPPHSLDHSPATGGAWRAIEVNLPPFIDERTTQWVIRALGSEFASPLAPNLVIFHFEDNQGDLDACLGLARYIVDLDNDAVQSVAFVRQSAQGSVGLVALSCDQLIMATEARLGGRIEGGGHEKLDEEALADLQPMIQALARDKQQDWSLMMSMLDPDLTVTRFRHQETGQLRLLSESELASLDSADDWAPLGPVDVENGLTAAAAEQSFIARTIADDEDQVIAFYQLDESPRSLQPSATDRFIERTASFLARPVVAMMLLFGGMFFLSSEMSAPGLGVPGFLSTMCFLMFFWSQYLGGNADWLEILLFLAGVACIGIEIFLIPGIGIFGIGGMLMVAISLILASQSFLVPKSTEEWSQLPQSLLPVLGAGLGLFAAIFALRKVLPNSPYFRNLMLDPNSRKIESGLDDDFDREAIVDWSHLAGQKGEAITRLVPAGKVRIAGKVYDVITDGRMVDKGQRVVVIEAIGNRVVVKPFED